MLSQSAVLEAVKNGKKSECLDGRDFVRLAEFFDEKDLGAFGVTLSEDAKEFVPVEWTTKNVTHQLESDVAFGFEKALGKRGISSGLMYLCVKMWLWILEDPLQNDESYAQYGLPLFKKVALKYGFDNPIGKSNGNERKYSEK